MPVQKKRNTLSKQERLNSRKAIELLFSGNSDTFIGFPLRVIFTWIERGENEEAISILISVPKKRFKRAVKRNRIKRQIRETYRIHKHPLIKTVLEKNKRLLIAFIYVDDKLHTTSDIEKSMEKLLEKMAGKISSLKE